MMPSPITWFTVPSYFAHGVHHQGQRRIEDLPGLLGVAPREQLHGVLEVGEQDRDLLALAFERALSVSMCSGTAAGGEGSRVARIPRRTCRSTGWRGRTPCTWR
jgi:hypothetical protein